jgi:D-alanyl-D-alanine-carboxypeptidase/D-alanyl-D-alanine-endopeptidase
MNTKFFSNIIWPQHIIILLISGMVCIACSQTLDIPEDVNESIQFRVDNGYNAGVVLGIISPDGRQYYSYGKTALKGGEKPNEDTVFEIGSFTKVFTGLLLADMVERGEVSLYEPIEKYLPKGVKVPKRNWRSITVGHLATHTSGLPRMPDNMGKVDLKNPYAKYSMEQMYEFLSKYELKRDIGAEYEYSNFGMGLLGHILELQSGLSYEELVVQRIANELEMNSTRITLTDEEMKEHLAKGHAGELEIANWDFKAMAGAGAIRSSARDMLTFLAANMGLKKSRLQSAMEKTHIRRHEAGLETMHIGLGWHIISDGEREVIWHNGGTGGYWCFAGFDKAEQKGIVVLTNSMQSVDDIGQHLFEPNVPLSEFKLSAEPMQVELGPDEKLPTSEEVMERSIDAMGGREALSKIQNRVTTATIEMPQMGLAGTITSYQARDNKGYTKVDFAGLMSTEQGCDGETVWELNPMTGPKVFQGQERAIMLFLYRFDDLDWRQCCESVDCTGKYLVDGKMYYEIKFTPKGCEPFTIYYSCETGLPFKIVFELPYAFGKMKVESTVGDYREIDGILYPYESMEKAMNMETVSKVERLEHNVEIPKDRFKAPEAIKNFLEGPKKKRKTKLKGNLIRNEGYISNHERDKK